MIKNFWTGKRVLVTGGTGFIGSFVCELLLEKGAKVTTTSFSGDLSKIKHLRKDLKAMKSDLREYKQAEEVIKNKDIVLNLASKVAGIQFNINHPATMFSDNVLIAQNVISASHKQNVERLLMVSSACVYPRFAKVPTPESEGFLDDPEPTNLGYGWSKRTTELLSRFYMQEHKMKIALARPYNAYGPRDNFNPAVSHVIPGLIKRVLEGENPLNVWGSGNQSRSFIYARDLARGLLLLTEKYAVCDPVNISSDEEIKIKDLAQLVIRLSGKKTKIVLDKSKPDGQLRRKSDTRKAKKEIGFETKTKLSDGLLETIEWYKNQLKNQK